LNIRISLAGRLAAICTLVLAAAAVAGALLSRALDPWWLGWLAAMLVSLPIAWLLIHRAVQPTARLVRALTDGADSFRDNDFSISVAGRRNDELGELVNAHNRLGSTLREERQSLFQRELLLDTVIQTTDIALLLTNLNDRIVYSNTAAKALFRQGRAIKGIQFTALLRDMPQAFQDIVSSGKSGLFTLDSDEPRTYHLSNDAFTLNGQPHNLYLFKHLTQEISRQEVSTWKKVIRVISHELNNSLAPISSLAHSGSALLDKSGANSDERLETIFNTIEDRSSHLKSFIESYARFARLPSPRPEAIRWNEFFNRLQGTVEFTVVEPLPESQVELDPGQFEQVMINLLKNAHESGSDPEAITVAVVKEAKRTVITSATLAVVSAMRFCKVRCYHSIQPKNLVPDLVCRYAGRLSRRMAVVCHWSMFRILACK